MDEPDQAVFILGVDENGRKIYTLQSDTNKQYVESEDGQGLIEASDPEVAELLCKPIKLERRDLGEDTSLEGVEESILPDDANCTIEFEDDDIEAEAEVADDVVMGIEEEDMAPSDLILAQSEEVVESLHQHKGITTGQEDLGKQEGEMLMQHMDIQEPLSTLKTLLELKLNSNLSEYEFWLQDAQILEGHKNLVDQCVQGEGLVQVNLEIKTDGNHKKINIMDVLKPAEEFVEIADEEEFEPTTVKKDGASSSETDKRIIRWTVDTHFKLEQTKLKIPADPTQWEKAHVRHWFQWAARAFNLVGVQLADWNLTGMQLCQMSLQDFQSRVPVDNGDLFWTHLELLRKCKFIAVVENRNEMVKALARHVSHVRGRPVKPNKIGRLPRVIGLPLNSDGLSCGNRTGNNGQIQLWQFLLELLTDKDHTNVIQWLGTDGEFKLTKPEMVAQLWGERKNKSTMNYEKLSRALRYYYDGDMIAKVHGKRFVYKFVCDLKQLLGYSASELNRLVEECANKSQYVDQYGTPNMLKRKHPSIEFG